jgi:hypothetical protein
MKRRLFNLAAAVSLVMMLALAALWVRSYWARDALWIVLRRGHPEHLACVSTISGQLQLALVRPPDDYKARHRLRYACDRDSISFFEPSDLWAFSSERVGAGAFVPWRVQLPIWCPLISAMIPLATLWRLLPRTHAQGKCATCGYDLRATPERCPECGTAVALKPAEAAA